jgi:hypothetical protein
MSARNPEQRLLNSTVIANGGGRPSLNVIPTILRNTSLGQTWKRNLSWPTLPAVTTANQRVVGLFAVISGGGNFWAASCSGDWQVDYGDGTTATTGSGGTLYKQFSYSASALIGTEAPVTLESSSNLVRRNNHGYLNGDAVQIYNITGNPGVIEGQTYYVISSSTNSFQLTTPATSSVIQFINNGSGSLLPYRVATVSITPQSGQNLTYVNLNVKHNQSNLQNNYTNQWLDLTVSVPSASISNSLFIGMLTGSTIDPRMNMLEQCNIVHSGLLQSTARMFAATPNLASVSASLPNVVTGSFMFTSSPNLISVLLTNTTNLVVANNLYNSCVNLKFASLDMSNVTDASFMFGGCRNLMDAPTLNTRNVINATNMFANCQAMVTAPALDLTGCVTASNMFTTCRNLTTVPIYNTGNIVVADIMFGTCNNLINAPMMDTSKIQNATNMFRQCWNLQNVPAYNLSSVTTTIGMFFECYSLKTVPLGLLNSLTNSCRTTESMFFRCWSLEYLPYFVIPARDTNFMFNSNFSLKSISVAAPSSSTSPAMFQSCTALESINIQFSPTAFTGSTALMFDGCNTLKTVTISGLDNATTGSQMFQNCNYLTDVNLSNTGKMTTMNSMFLNCFSLKTAPTLNTVSASNMSSMFQGCTALSTVPQYDTRNVTNFQSMFSGCTNLTKVPVLDMSSGSSGNFANMVASCPSLQDIVPSGSRFSLSLANCQLSGETLNRIYDALPSASGQTITVTGNFGTATHNTGSVVAKGWTVVP